MSHEDWEAWDAEEPPRDFATRVVAEAMNERAAQKKGRGARIGAGLLLVGSLAAGVALANHLKNAHAQGDVTAQAREEVRVGGRAIAVLEPGAHVKWNGDAIDQADGNVFWRVEPGARFTVHTPAADVTVKGTCFRVQVSEDEGAMNRRDAKSGAVGAVLAATAFVGVYEGKVAVSHAGESVDITAGQSARANAQGVHRLGGKGPDGEELPEVAAAASEGEKALTEANANLAQTVQSYRRKLEALDAQKKKVEKDLAQAQAKLGDAGPLKSEYELSQQDWKDLAKEGEVRMRVPCSGPTNDFAPSANVLNKLGLAPQDGPLIQQAMQQSHARTWGLIEPLCSQALGGIDVSRLGQQACVSILMDTASSQGSESYNEAVREVAEIQAGMRAAPGPNDNVPPIERAYLALAGESQSIVSDLSQSIGAEDAKRVVYADQGCWWNSSHGVGPRGEE